jgi:hypothetical protein
MVVYTRPFEASGELQPVFSGDQPIDVAFAIWDGSQQERDGIKSVSSFTQLTITPEDPPRQGVEATEDWPAYSPPTPILAYSLGFIALIAAVGGAVWFSLRRRREEPDVEES